MRPGLIVLAAVALSIPVARADEPPPDVSPTPTPPAAVTETPAVTGSKFDQMSLEELLQVPIMVTTRDERPIREAPGVVTLITRDQMRNAGARDLMDALALVPGIAFGVDTESIVSLGIRGNWGEEGKVLLLVDGQDLNELLYLNLPLGNHLPVDQIERIEVVRGPGSVIYGGSAELAVINIVTRGAKELSGGAASVVGGMAERGVMREGAAIAWGQAPKTPDAFSWSLSGFLGRAHRSDAIYNDFGGNSFDMQKQSTLDDVYLNAGASWKGLKLRYLFDDYLTRSRDGYDLVFSQPRLKQFSSHLAGVEDEIRLSDGLTITPRFAYKYQQSWRTPQMSLDVTYYDPVTVRYEGEVVARWEIAKGLKLLAGTTEHEDEYWLNSNYEGVRQTGLDVLLGNRPIIDDSVGVPTRKQHNFNVAGFAEVLWNAPIANVSAGGRVDHNSKFGDSFEPRVAVTRVFDPFHVKLLYSKGFRPPGLGNLDYNKNLHPEKTTALEAEAGWRISERALLTANVFDITVESPILYTSAIDSNGTYSNYARTGTLGTEFSLQASAGPATVNATYSYYTAAGRNRVTDYEVPGHGDVLQGFSHHKGTLAVTAPIHGKLHAGATAVGYGERWGYVDGDGAGTPVLGHRAPVALVNGFAELRDVGPHLDVRVGLYNALGSRYELIEPYLGAHPPLPAEPREAVLHIAATF